MRSLTSKILVLLKQACLFTFLQDLAVLEEVFRMVLEIINSTVTYSLHHNPNLVYTLLYKRETFDPFRAHPMFQDVIQNIDLVLGFFSKR